MIAQEIRRPYSCAQSWWQNFTAESARWPDNCRHQEFKEYVQQLNDQLIPQGGYLRWYSQGGKILVTFRREEDFTMFLLRWA